MTQSQQRIIAERSDWANAFSGSGALHIRYARGEMICQIGSYAAGVYLVRRGIVSESLGGEGGTGPSGAFEILGPGDLIGLEVLLGRGEALHAACSRAIADVELAFLARVAFADAVDQDVDLRWRLLAHLAVRHLSVRRALSRSRSSTKERLCHLLLDLGHKLGRVTNGEEVQLPMELDLRTLTDLLGISTSQVRRARDSLPSLHEEDGRIHFSSEALTDQLSVLA
ncbi:MAG: Crp/Fnr family transcriptional regulator [Candidatus Bipolaricaulia bacterium]